MTHEIETGFGSGLRAQLSRKLGAEEASELQDVPAVPEQPAEILPLGDVLPLMPETLVDEPAEVAAFVRSVIQAEQLGISLGRILRVQAADSRLRRQAAAEERAMKAPIKMLFPTALFIFPAMFVVILGPAFLNITTYLNFK